MVFNREGSSLDVFFLGEVFLFFVAALFSPLRTKELSEEPFDRESGVTPPSVSEQLLFFDEDNKQSSFLFFGLELPDLKQSINRIMISERLDDLYLFVFMADLFRIYSSVIGSTICLTLSIFLVNVLIILSFSFLSVSVLLMDRV